MNFFFLFLNYACIKYRKKCVKVFFVDIQIISFWDLSFALITCTLEVVKMKLL